MKLWCIQMLYLTWHWRVLRKEKGFIYLNILISNAWYVWLKVQVAPVIFFWTLVRGFLRPSPLPQQVHGQYSWHALLFNFSESIDHLLANQAVKRIWKFASWALITSENLDSQDMDPKIDQGSLKMQEWRLVATSPWWSQSGCEQFSVVLGRHQLHLVIHALFS